jgi:hypothetical protein
MPFKNHFSLEVIIHLDNLMVELHAIRNRLCGGRGRLKRSIDAGGDAHYT